MRLLSPIMSLRLARAAVLVGALLPPGAGALAQGGDLGREWLALKPENASIVFSAPGLDGQRVRFLRTQADNLSYTVENAVWTGPDSRYAKAVLQYVKLSPGYRFPVAVDPQVLVDRFDGLKGKNIAFDRSRFATNALGRITYRRFRFDQVACIVFLQQWGAGDGAGDQQLGGYYCNEPGEPLGFELTQRVLDAIRIRDTRRRRPVHLK